jgi:hypothetical protein
MHDAEDSFPAGKAIKAHGEIAFVSESIIRRLLGNRLHIGG